MGTYTATLRWERGEHSFTDDRYSRGHRWTFDGGVTVPASASPQIVPLPDSVAEAVDPEEAFVAAVSSCHLLTFLAIAAKRGFRVDTYVDEAVGYMEKNEAGKLAITRVVLRPAATYSGDKLPTQKDLEYMHHRAHEICFIANSVRSEIVTEIVS
ncbi:MAG: OsmC family protein [Gammaproteobacteria bacterium]|nr:OsmC family protein [Gammaproteobacteria bacterium]MDH4254491.1 OsmC family protein [Gammaproteobacteria bacterium]MDH5309095.1 OsmC family protein [Gammaproteobacteria bacterium]